MRCYKTSVNYDSFSFLFQIIRIIIFPLCCQLWIDAVFKSYFGWWHIKIKDLSEKYWTPSISQTFGVEHCMHVTRQASFAMGAPGSHQGLRFIHITKSVPTGPRRRLICFYDLYLPLIKKALRLFFKIYFQFQ